MGKHQYVEFREGDIVQTIHDSGVDADDLHYYNAGVFSTVTNPLTEDGFVEVLTDHGSTVRVHQDHLALVQRNKGLLFDSISEINNAIQKARIEAFKDAQNSCGRRGILRSRGAWFVTANEKQGPVAPCNENYYNGSRISMKAVRALVADVEKNYPEVDEIWIDGGYDYAESVRDFSDGCYDAWVSDWSILIWKKG